MPNKRDAQWRTELNDLLRGVAGGLLFGAPFLYTMEVWQAGSRTGPIRMLAALLLTYLVLMAINHVSGFREWQSGNWLRAAGDSAEALAVGLVTAAGALALLGLITPRTGWTVALGRTVMEGIPFAIGVGIAHNLLVEKQEEHSAHGEPDEPGDPSLIGTLADAGATALGAVIVSASIAPTEEIPHLAAAIEPPWLLGVVAASLIISYLIVFEAEFVSQRARLLHRGVFHGPIGETVFSYLISLGLALTMLWLFQVVRPGDPWPEVVSLTVIMGLPATIGGAAGRLAV